MSSGDNCGIEIFIDRHGVVTIGKFARIVAIDRVDESSQMLKHRPDACPFNVTSVSLVAILLLTRISVADEAQKPPFESEIRADKMRPHVEFLASPNLAGRSGPAKAEARKYIVDQWKAASLQPLFSVPDATKPANVVDPDVDSFEQVIPGAKAEDGTIPILGRNFGAWLPGSDPNVAHEFVIVSAHYDHLGTRDGAVFAGADDNATGVAMLIEVARLLAAEKTAPRRSMVFVAFDLEEHMLWGSRWFAAHPPWPIEHVKLFVTADMIGRSLGNLPLPAVFVMGSERAAELRSTLDLVGAPTGLEVCRLGTDIVGTRSDYGPFRDREIPFLFFSTGEHPDYHTPRDTPDKIDYEKAAKIASVMLKVSRNVANADQVPVWSPPVTQNMDEPKVLNRIATLLLEADKQKPLTQTQRFLVTNVRNRSKQMIEANKMTDDDRTWLVRMSQLLLLSVF